MKPDVTCTSEDAIRVLGRIRDVWGGYPIPEGQEHEFLRLFRNHSLTLLRQALDFVIARDPERRPSPAQFSEAIRIVSRQTNTINPEPWPDVDPQTVSEHINEIRSLLRVGAGREG